MMTKRKDENSPPKKRSGSQNEFFLICSLLGNAITGQTPEEEIVDYSAQDWEEFWRVSRVHNVTELLFPHVKKLNMEGLIPDEVLERFRQFVYPRASANSWLLQTGNEVRQKLFGNGIETIALKGLFLQQAVYGHDEVRPMNDIDLLVRREDVPKAIEILNNHGFRLETHFDADFENEDIKHVPPMWNEFGQILELHWNLLEEDEPFSINMDQVWAQKQCFPNEMWGLSVEQLIVHLAIHGTYQHHLRLGLRSLLDISRVIEKYKDEIQWGLVASTARAWRAEKTLWLSLKLLEKYLSVGLPEDVILSLEPQNSAKIFDRACELTETLTAIRTVLSPDLIELSKEKYLASRLRRIIKRIFIPKKQLARLYNINPQSIMIYPAYVRRLMDLSRHYHKTIKKIDSRSNLIRNDVNLYEEQLALHRWLGIKD